MSKATLKITESNGATYAFTQSSSAQSSWETGKAEWLYNPYKKRSAWYWVVQGSEPYPYPSTDVSAEDTTPSPLPSPLGVLLEPAVKGKEVEYHGRGRWYGWYGGSYGWWPYGPYGPYGPYYPYGPYGPYRGFGFEVRI